MRVDHLTLSEFDTAMAYLHILATAILVLTLVNMAGVVVLYFRYRPKRRRTAYNVACPGCRSYFRVPAYLAGRSVRCTNCETVSPVPTEGDLPAPRRPKERK